MDSSDDRMIRVTVWLDGDDLPGAAEGEIVPGHAWDHGFVTVGRSEAHGLAAEQAMPFHGMTGAAVAIEEALEAAGVTLHRRPGRPARPGRHQLYAA